MCIVLGPIATAAISSGGPLGTVHRDIEQNGYTIHKDIKP